MGDSLPEKFDLVVVGTGLVESMVAAAAARLGHSVLHLDTASYYGGQWASFTWDGLQTWVKEQAGEGNSNVEDVRTEWKKQEEEEEKCVLQEGERLVALDGKNKVQNLVEIWHEHTDADGKDLTSVENPDSGDDSPDREKMQLRKSLIGLKKRLRSILEGSTLTLCPVFFSLVGRWLNCSSRATFQGWKYFTLI